MKQFDIQQQFSVPQTCCITYPFSCQLHAIEGKLIESLDAFHSIILVVHWEHTECHVFFLVETNLTCVYLKQNNIIEFCILAMLNFEDFEALSTSNWMDVFRCMSFVVKVLSFSSFILLYPRVQAGFSLSQPLWLASICIVILFIKSLPVVVLHLVPFVAWSQLWKHNRHR